MSQSSSSSASCCGPSAPNADTVHEQVRAYYGEHLSDSDDLRTNACCDSEAPSGPMKARLAKLHDETMSKYYGCGLIAPEALEGAYALDLGCGAGRDVYVLSQMVGAEGHVAGVDMTRQQLDAAERHLNWHMERFGFEKPNVAFHEGLIEKLDALPLAQGGFDVCVSNCVVNLAADKMAVFEGVRRLLKEGGEFYFSDVYADRPISEEAKADPVLYGECLSGALVWDEFLQMAKDAGFADARLISANTIAPKDEALEAKLGGVKFTSATVRLFNAPSAPARSFESQAAIYKGGLEGAEEALVFDEDLTLKAGEPTPICAQTAAIFASSRFAKHIKLTSAAPGANAVWTDKPAPFENAAPAKSGCC